MVYRVISIVIALFYMCIVARYLVRLGIFINKYKKVKKISEVNLNKKILFVLPMFKETKIAKETFNFFTDIAKTNDNIYVAFVCTAKEDNQVGDIETTYDILNKCKSNENNDKIKLYKYPKLTGVMAHQVNYAVE